MFIRGNSSHPSLCEGIDDALECVVNNKGQGSTIITEHQNYRMLQCYKLELKYTRVRSTPHLCAPHLCVVEYARCLISTRRLTLSRLLKGRCTEDELITSICGLYTVYRRSY